MKRNDPSIGIIMPSVEKTSRLFLSSLVAVLHPLCRDMYVVAGNVSSEDCGRTHVYSIDHNVGSNIFSMIINQILYQVRVSYRLLRLRKHVQVWVFFLGAQTLMLPMVTAKLLGKKTLVLTGGSLEKEGRIEKGELYRIRGYMKRVNLALANRIVVYTQNLIKEWGLEKYEHKILIGHRHFVDFDSFSVQKSLKERGNVVGYVGVLSETKGVSSLLRGIQGVVDCDQSVRFMIIGEGPLEEEAKGLLAQGDLGSVVRMLGWVDHDELPAHLNSFKLLILPSYSEGLPNVMIEAMGCGTPVLATAVGGIRDFVNDGQTGFVMENNSPECIASNVVRALNHPGLEEIANNARALVEKEFTYEAAVERYRRILSEVAT